MENNELLTILKDERLKRKITQSEIANYLNLDVSAISLLESGKRKITIDLLDKWLGFFGMKYTIVNANTKEISTIPKGEIQEFQRLKNRRNEIIYNRHLKQVELLKELFPNKTFFANGNMKVVAMVDHVDLQSGDTAIIYYNNLVVNASLSDLVDLADLVEEGSVFGFNIGISQFNIAQLDYLHLAQYKWTDEGVILYKENSDVYIRDARGFTTDLLMDASNTLTHYNQQVYQLLESIQENSYENEEMEMIQQKIREYVEKWQISPYENHPQFEYWTKEDFDSTFYIDNPKHLIKNLLQ